MCIIVTTCLQLIVLIIYSDYLRHLHGFLYRVQWNIFFTLPDGVKACSKRQFM